MSIEHLKEPLSLQAGCRRTPTRCTRGHLVGERPVCLRLQDPVCSAPLQCVLRDPEGPEKLHESHQEQVPSFPDSIGRPDRVNGRESSSLPQPKVTGSSCATRTFLRLEAAFSRSKVVIAKGRKANAACVACRENETSLSTRACKVPTCANEMPLERRVLSRVLCTSDSQKAARSVALLRVPRGW